MGSDRHSTCQSPLRHPAVELCNRSCSEFAAERDGVRIAEGLYCPEFGVTQERKVLEVDASGPQGEVRWILRS